MHDLIKDLTEYLGLTPEQQFRVSAKIKRHIHSEKASVYHRQFLYSQGRGIYDRTDPENPVLVDREPAKDPYMNKISEEKYKSHMEMAKLPDEEVITWSVGSFKYVQKIQPCSVCNAELTGTKGYSSQYKNGVYSTFCPEHAPKDEE